MATKRTSFDLRLLKATYQIKESGGISFLVGIVLVSMPQSSQ